MGRGLTKGGAKLWFQVMVQHVSTVSANLEQALVTASVANVVRAIIDKPPPK